MAMGKIDKFICFIISGFVRLIYNNRLLVLNYHRVHEHNDIFFSSDIDKVIFDWQIYLVSKYFNPLPLKDACAKLYDNCLPANAVVVTFDDGYKDNIENASPILNNYNISATFFIATGFLNGGIMWNDVIIESIKNTTKPYIDLTKIGLEKYPVNTDKQKGHAITESINKIKYLNVNKRLSLVAVINKQCEVNVPTHMMMDDQDILELDQMGMEIGGHTKNHPILLSEPDLAVESEIIDGKVYLEKLLRHAITSFAYPNGKLNVDYTDKHAQMVDKAGFSQAVTTNWGLNTSSTSRFELFRFTPWDRTPIKFMLRILKLYLFNKV